jgi:hypothetical protein
MNRLLRWILGLTLLTIILLILFAYFQFNVENLVVNLKSDPGFIAGGLFLTSGLIIFIIIIQLIRRYRVKRTEIITTLTGYFVLTFLSTIVQGFFEYFSLSNDSFKDFWTQTVYIYAATGLLFMTSFIFEIFFKGFTNLRNKIYFIILSIAVVIFNIYIIFTMFYQMEDIFVIIFGGIMYLTILFTYLSLARNGFYLSKRVKHEDRIASRAFYTLGWSGITLMIGFFILFLYIALKSVLGAEEWMEILDYTALAIMMIGYILLYFGFIFPMRQTQKEK